MKKIECYVTQTTNGIKLQDKATNKVFLLYRSKITGGASHYLQQSQPESRYISGMFFDKANRYYYGNDSNMIRYEVALNPKTNEATITVFDKITKAVKSPVDDMPF